MTMAQQPPGAPPPASQPPAHDWQTSQTLCRLPGRSLVRRADKSAAWIYTRPVLAAGGAVAASPANTVRTIPIQEKP